MPLTWANENIHRHDFKCYKKSYESFQYSEQRDNYLKIQFMFQQHGLAWQSLVFLVINVAKHFQFSFLTFNVCDNCNLKLQRTKWHFSLKYSLIHTILNLKSDQDLYQDKTFFYFFYCKMFLIFFWTNSQNFQLKKLYLQIETLPQNSRHHGVTNGCKNTKI